MSISVVIPLYNKEEYIGRAISSVLAQTYSDFELIVVNDGSTDNSAEIVKSFKDPRICIKNKKNMGVSAARNTGILLAKYELLAFLDADDEWMPYFLETIMLLQEKYQDCGAFATAYKIINKNMEQNICLNNIENDKSKELIIDNYFNIIQKFEIIFSSAVAIKKSTFNKIGLFLEYITQGEDIEMWNRIALKYKYGYSNKICSKYHLNLNKRLIEKANIKREINIEKIETAINNNIYGPHININDLKNYLSYLYIIYGKHYIYNKNNKKGRGYIYKAIKNKYLVIKCIKYILYSYLSTNMREFINKLRKV